MTERRPATLRRAVSEDQKEARRVAILSAAKSVFAEKGFHEATMADVARGAGLSYGSVYWYFPSKDELFDALMSASESQLRGRIREALRNAPEGDMAVILRHAAAEVFRSFDEDKAGARLLFRDTGGLGTRFERQLVGIFERFMADLELLVLDAQRRGELRAAPPRVVSYSLASLIGQLALRRLLTDDDLDADEAAGVVVDLAFEGLRPRATAAAPKKGRSR